MLSDMVCGGGFQNCHTAAGGRAATRASTVQLAGDAICERMPTAAMASTHALMATIFVY